MMDVHAAVFSAAVQAGHGLARVEQALKIATTWVHFDRRWRAYRDDVRAALSSFHTELGEQLFKSVSMHHKNLRDGGKP